MPVSTGPTDAGREGRRVDACTRPVRQAVILAGGLGQRLRPWTDERPKAMVEVRGIPLLRHQLDWFAASGVDRVVVSAGHLAQVIVDYLGSRSLPLGAVAVVEERPLGRGGGLKLASQALPYPGEPWLAVYGDIWTGLPLAGMWTHHARHGLPATVALAGPGLPGHGVRYDRNDRVTALDPALGPRGRVNAGIYLFGWDVVGLLPDEGDHIHTTLPGLISTRRLSCYRMDAPWRAVNTPADLARLERDLAGRTEAGGSRRSVTRRWLGGSEGAGERR